MVLAKRDNYLLPRSLTRMTSFMDDLKNDSSFYISTGLRTHSSFPVSGVPLAVHRPHRHHLHDGGHRPREVLGRLRTIEDPDNFRQAKEARHLRRLRRPPRPHRQSAKIFRTDMVIISYKVI